ncbi:MAG TPA: carboxylesterase/lipase family protein [Acidimicrobiales bacterium]|nr:carboxylesterase/lipase family protein [Acidimicrobiales bacterium]
MSPQPRHAPEITLSVGRLRGALDDGVAAYRGIPYAAPPVGAARFAPPRPAAPWDGVRDATEFATAAPQNSSPLMRPEPTSEDCLALNVWTPDITGSAPVMVWIHGGGFTTGSGSSSLYRGAALARRGVVVVTLNYRLGALGFLHLADLGGEAWAGSGNLGLLDQVAALDWVAEHIGAFGGDPDRVTVFGESAGAMSVGALLAVPAATRRFGRAILQSGAQAHVHEPAAASEVARRLLAAVDVDPGDLDALRDVPVERLLGAQAAVAAETGGSGLPFQPVVDGTVLVGHPADAVAAGAAAGIDLLVGTTLEETRLWTVMGGESPEMAEDHLVARFDRALGEAGIDGHEALAVYRQRLAGAPAADVATALSTDQVFRAPAIRLLERQAPHAQVWSYLFTRRSTAHGGVLGSCHALELPFVFDTLDADGMRGFVGERTAAVRALAAAMADAWVAFATAGDPSTPALGTWPPYAPSQRSTMVLDVDPRVEDDPLAAERELWARVGGR